MKNILFSLLLFSVPVMTCASEAPKKSDAQLKAEQEEQAKIQVQFTKKLYEQAQERGVPLEQIATKSLGLMVLKDPCDLWPILEAHMMCGANVNSTQFGFPFIWHASNCQAIKTLKLLLDHRADVNAQGRLGSCLAALARSNRSPNALACAQLLLQYKADPASDLERIQGILNSPKRYDNPEMKALLEEAIAHRLAQKKSEDGKRS